MGQMPKLEYFNMELNPMNPALQEVVETIPRWNVSGCQDFARQIYTLTVQLPNVSAELRRMYFIPLPRNFLSYVCRCSNERWLYFR